MNIDNKFLLVCLQLIIILLMSFKIAEGREVGSPTNLGRVNRLLESIEPGPFTSRAYFLYSRSSRKNVIVQDRVSATANKTDFKGILEFQTVMVMAGGVRTRIHGLYTDRYICFNHKGRLVTKPKKRARGAKCEFVEELTMDGYSQFRSAKNGDWYVGFNPKGKPLLGRAHSQTRSKDCFDFLKLNSIPHPHRHRYNNHNGNFNSNHHSNSNNNNKNGHRHRHHHQMDQQGKHGVIFSDQQFIRGRVSSLTNYRNHRSNKHHSTLDSSKTNESKRNSSSRMDNINYKNNY